MSAKEIGNAYLNLLWDSFQYDVSVLSNWWMWVLLLIPAVFYILFMYAKYYFLLLPIWLPFHLLRITFRKEPSYVSTGNFVEDMIKIRSIAAERIKRENPKKPVAKIRDNGK